MFGFLVTFGWALILIGAIIQIFTAVLNLLIIQQVALPTVLGQINDIFQKSIFKQDDILNRLTGNVWQYTILALTILVAVGVITLVSFELNRIKKGQRISKPYIKMILVTLIIASLVYGKVSVLILAAFTFIGMLFIESALFDVEALQNFAEERNMVVVYRQDKRFEREVNKEGKYHGSATLGVGATIGEIENTAKNFKNNDYINVDDKKANLNKKTDTMFSTKELNDLFNDDKEDIRTDELANLISDMSRAESFVKKSTKVEQNTNKNEKVTINKEEDITVDTKVEEPILNENISSTVSTLSENNFTTTEEIAEKAEPQIEESKVINDIEETLSFSPNKFDYNEEKPIHANIESFTDSMATVGNDEEEKDDLLETDSLIDEGEELVEKNNEADFDFLNDDLLNTSSTEEAKEMTKKEKKLFNKWNEMYQQALQIKMLVDEEVKVAGAPTKIIKKSAKVYNNLAKEANSLVGKLKLGTDKHLKIMHIAEMFGSSSQATEDFINDSILSADDISVEEQKDQSVLKEDDINLNTKFDEFNLDDDGDIDDLDEEIQIDNFSDMFTDDFAEENNKSDINTPTATENKTVVSETVLFSPEEHNINKLKFELLDEVQTSDSNQEDVNDYLNDSNGYTFTELEGLDDFNDFDDILLKDSEAKAVKFNDSDEKTNEIDHDVIETITEEIKVEPIETESINKVDAPLSETTKSEVNLTEEIPTPAKTKIEESDYIRTNAELLDDIVVSEPIKSTTKEFKPVLNEEVSYSLDELDDKIMNGDFSNLDDEMIQYTNESTKTVVNDVNEKTVVTTRSVEKNVDNNINIRLEKLEELIKDSINLQSIHTKTLFEVQTHLTSLTMKVEALEERTNGFAKKLEEVEIKDHENRRGVVPIDQYYPRIDDINLSSARYNLYNKKGYSNTYGTLGASDPSHGTGNYYRQKGNASIPEDFVNGAMKHVDYNHINLHNISKYTKQDILFEVNCPLCKKINK